MEKIARRAFIKKTVTASAGAMLLPSFLEQAVAEGFFDKPGVSKKKLVIIQLSGGNDGLNTIVPYTNPLYFKARPSLAVPADQVLKAGENLGFNPAMQGIYRLFEENKVCVINNVGYPHPNRSHFRSMDIWQTASGSGKYLNTGWIGRYLDTLPHDLKKPYMAVETENRLSLALKGKKLTGIAVSNPVQLHNALRKGFFQPLASAYRTEIPPENKHLDYIRRMMIETVDSVEYIYEKTEPALKNQPKKPARPFAAGLFVIRTMIRSGLATSVYYITLDGFDTHVRQKQRQDNLLKEYSDAVTSFVDGLESDALLDDVLIFTFSEFGRRVEENASKGTDHGTASNVWLIGGGLKKTGFYNPGPNLSDLDQGDLKFTVDFRSVYATLLQDYLGVSPKAVLGAKFPVLGFV